MNVSAAISYLKLSEDFSKDDVVDAFEEAIFLIKKELLSKPIVISRCKNKQALITSLIEAKDCILDIKTIEVTKIDCIKLSTDSLLAFMQDYEIQLAKAKLNFSNAQVDLDLIKSIQDLINVQSYYESHYPLFFDYSKITEQNYNGKLSEQISSSVIIAYLKLGDDLYKSPNPAKNELLRINSIKKIPSK